MRFELLHFSKLNRIGGACLGARRFQPIFQSIIAKCAFVRRVISIPVALNHTKGTRDDTITASIANILLYVDGIKLSANNRPRWTCFLARRVSTMFTHIALHQPAIGIEKRQSRAWRAYWNLGASYMLDKQHMTPGCSAQPPCIVVT